MPNGPISSETTNNGNQTKAQLQAQLDQAQKERDELQAQLETEQKKNEREVYLKVSEKGGASLYGIRRFPVTFYVEEWNRILDMEPQIRGFLVAHADELTTKN
jgi:hypothetical protein